jgi:ATP-dependent DNA helicase DinG
MAADIVVVNHHLFFADLALRDSGVAELLPTVDVAVFDEAHQMVEAGVQFLGQTLGTGQMMDFARDLLAAGLQHARGLAPWSELSSACELAARELRLACAGDQREVRGVQKRRWDEAARGEALGLCLDRVTQALRAAAEALEGVVEAAPDFIRLQSRAKELAAQCMRFHVEAAPERVRWIDLTPNQARLIESPLDIRAMMSEQRAAASRAWVFTSATLGDDEGLSWFSEAAGLDDARKLRVGSPFDYPAHARVYVPPRFPAPSEAAHLVMVGRAAAHCAAALGGHTFVLTTTLRALSVVAEAMTKELQTLGSQLDLLVQGSAAKRTLLDRFQAGRSVLLGSHSFWEGIDVPGDALQCVIIDKLPFPPPNDPLVEARVKQLKSQGRDAFNDYFVAEAAIALKQGAGRLIRTETDRGLLVVCDTRLRQARYGARLLAALPPMTVLDSGEQALAWLRELAALRPGRL